MPSSPAITHTTSIKPAASRKLAMTTVLLCALCARAGEFTLDWVTLDGGGVQESAGGDFKLSATAGQPDAGAASGGDFVLQSGFWSGITDEPGWTVPSLRMGWLAQQPAVFWPSSATNWLLEATVELAPANWKDLGANPTVIGDEFAFPVDINEPRMNYRLRRIP